MSKKKKNSRKQRKINQQKLQKQLAQNKQVAQEKQQDQAKAIEKIAEHRPVEEDQDIVLLDIEDEAKTVSKKIKDKSKKVKLQSKESKEKTEKVKQIIIPFIKRVGLFAVLFIYLEMLFHFLSVHGDASFVPLKLVLCLPTAFLFALPTLFFPKKAGNILEAVLLGFTLIYYSINLMYHDAFQVYFSISFINASNTKITQYYREIWESVQKNAVGLALIIIIPTAVYVFLRIKKKLGDTNLSIKKIGFWAAGFALSVAICVGTVFAYGKASYSPYDLVAKDFITEFSFAKLGVYATAEVEIKNLLIGNKEEEEEEFVAWVYDPNSHGSSSSNSSASSSSGSSQAGSDVNGNSNSGAGVGSNTSSNGGTNTGTNADGNSGTNGSGATNGATDALEEIIEEIDTSPNILDIDFVSLAENESNSEVAKIHSYFSSVEPSYKNEYTGMFEGFNLIFMTCEAFCPLAVDEELTPTLYKLVNEGFVFNNFYNPRTSGSTSDGEFVCSTSLVPTNRGATNYRIAGQNSMPFALGNMFNMKYDIISKAYHDNDYTYYDRHKTYPGMGYYYLARGNGLEISRAWPESDLEMMEVSIPQYIDDDLFNVYYMTVSGHMNYNFSGNAMSLKHYDEVKDLPYSTACKAYLGCQMELDRALEYLIAQLEEKGIADRTVICFTGDHWPYGLTNDEYSELLGHTVEPNFELYKSNLVLWSGAIKEPIVVDKYCCSMDIIPTLLNLFGFDYDSRLLMGRDILSDTEGFVIFINKSLITDKLMYNSQTGAVTYLTDEELPEGYLENAKAILNNRWKYSQKIMDYDYYQYICDELGIEIPIVEQNYTW